MTYQHHRQKERYEIHAFMKAGQAISRIVEIIGGRKSTISRELTRNVGFRGDRPRQAQRFAELRGRNSRNSWRADAFGWSQAKALLIDNGAPSSALHRSV